MDTPKTAVRSRIQELRQAMVDDERRRSLIFVCFNFIMGFVSACMTVVNVFTAKWLLMSSTLLFAMACLLNLLLYRRGGLLRRLSSYLFLLEALCLCGFFCISGTPEGFSALWTCFIPSYTLAFLGRKMGSLYSGVTFLMVATLFWTPWGRALLQYQYTDSFKLRFPMIYLAFFIMALLLETIRFETQHQLIEAERRYQYLYKHDALTGIYNRYGFNELMNQIFAAPDVGALSLLILDLDLFKGVNDTYGHDAGDVVLRLTADTLRRLTGEDAAVCRWGGEEFTVLLWGGQDASQLAEQIRCEMEAAEIRSGASGFHITVSIGACTVADRKDVTIAQMVKSADLCLYQAKQAGRNTVFSTTL